MFSMAGNDVDLYDFFWKKNFRFSQEVITRYCLALMSKPFVILTGISGTGKTKIAEIFAKYYCGGDKDRIAFVPVRPDWMDNRGLLGYYNVLFEDYYVTPVLRLLLRARNNPKQPYFVILDEMNLSKVEYYFSDFLSILETRTVDDPNGEPLPLHERNGGVKAHGDEKLIPSRLPIPSNVYFTGTVNVDESTYMFSPKVLDRANVIEFNEVLLPDEPEPKPAGSIFRLRETDVRERLLAEETKIPCSMADYHKAREVADLTPLAELLRLLERYHLHFGYRAISEMSRFVWLAHEHVYKLNAEDKLKADEVNEVLDIQFLQKVLPKFHGTKGQLEDPLSDLLCFCYPEKIQVTEERRDQAKRLDRSARFPRTAQKCARMLSTLEKQGYASFIEYT
jgi:5-methylcytosine-specific restriction enzyme B